MRLPLSVVLIGMFFGSVAGQPPKEIPKSLPKDNIKEAPKEVRKEAPKAEPIDKNSPLGKELAVLQGEWEVTYLLYNGKDMTKRFPMSFVFADDSATVEGSGAVKKEYAKLKFKLDPSTTPKIADVTVVGGIQDSATLEGIYEIKGKDLQICLKVFAPERPSEFAAEGGSNQVLLKLKLVAAAQPEEKAKGPNLTRFEKTIEGFEATDKKVGLSKDPIVFTGSSSIARWKDVAKAFPEYPVLNRGFGGSTTPEVNHYFDRVIYAYKPKVVVFFCGGNDLAAKAPPTKVIDDFRTFVKMTHEKLPATRIVYISQHRPPTRVKLKNEFNEVNAAVRADAKKDRLLTYVNIADKMLKNGEPNPDLYAADKLHPNDAAYKIWAEELRPVLKAAYAGAPAN